MADDCVCGIFMVWFNGDQGTQALGKILRVFIEILDRELFIDNSARTF